MLTRSYGANNNNSIFLGLHENSTAIHDTTLDLLTIIEEVGNILEVNNKVLAELSSSRKLLNQGNELDHVDFAVG